MSSGLARSASVLQFAYSATLVVLGMLGIFTPRWEFATFYGVDPATLPLEAQATLLNQYRFLKAIELSAGIFCFAFRPSIMDGGRGAGVFLAIVGFGVGARAFAWIVDGRPSAFFVTFVLLEALVFIVVALHLRKSDG